MTRTAASILSACMNDPHHDFSKVENVRKFLDERGCKPGLYKAGAVIKKMRKEDVKRASELARALFGDNEHKPAKG